MSDATERVGESIAGKATNRWVEAHLLWEEMESHSVPMEAITALSPHQIDRPIMLQGWKNLAALHWSFSPDEVQRLLPRGFTVDVFDGRAWVGIIPFEMERIRIPGLPPFGRLSSFPETNLRTYIVDPRGRRGVWFFSLDITRLVPALVARTTYRLPYCWASMSVEQSTIDGLDIWDYRSIRRWPAGGATSQVKVRVLSPLPNASLGELDRFLTARWALGSTFGRRLMWANVVHPEWPLFEAEVLHCNDTLFEASGLNPPTGEPIARWSPGVEVSIERPRITR